MSLSAFAADPILDPTKLSDESTVTFTVDPTYSVTIPAQVVLAPTGTTTVTYEETTTVTADNVRIAEDKELVISISGDFKLDAGGTSTYELDYSVTIDPEGSATALPASGVIATFVSPLANRSGSVELKFAADDPDYAGVYTDRLTFTLAVI